MARCVNNPGRKPNTRPAGLPPQAWAAVSGYKGEGPKMADKKPNALQTPLTPSAELAAIVGSAKLARGEVVKKVWDYIKANNLQDAKDKRRINADAKLKPIFGVDSVTMFEMNKHLAKHLS
ncbi:SWIB/MDM2 domain-containing protein [Sandaracinobacter sp.]|jgi:chromatin remodeling complex protein RSC6|uniref:SWIB/MDM2 domain-containing protein n=1 Tax=Sandaracinobacter sp. TaxID=2487581 RepID=UPI0035B0930E